jgi:hypothetical protein
MHHPEHLTVIEMPQDTPEQREIEKGLAGHPEEALFVPNAQGC